MYLIYSGNFIGKVQKKQFCQIRVVMGIHPEHFCWKLEPGESFEAPEAVLVYSDEGLGKMTRTFFAHVSDCPNHITGRSTPFDTREIVASTGAIGYELDVTKISEEDRNKIP